MELRADVLARILVLQSVIGQLPDEPAVFAFLGRGLEDVPGVARVRHVPAGVTADAEAHPRFPLHVNGTSFGELVVELSDTAAFAPYFQYIHNVSFMVAVILDSRRLEALQKQHTHELEDHVQQRTRSLSHEIAERQMAEWRAQEAQRRAERYLEISEAMILELDATGRIQVINERGCTLLGRPQAELIGCDWFEVAIAAPEREAIRSVFDKALTGEVEVSHYENDILDRSGRTLHISWHNIRLLDEHGHCHGMISSGIDITAHQRAEEALRESERRFRILFEQAAVGVAQIDTATGRFLRVNRKYADIVGYTPEEMEATDFQHLTHSDDLAVDLANMERLKAGAISEFTMEKRYLRKDGGVVWVSLTVSPMWRPGEAPLSHVAVVEDITERKQAQRERDQLNELLHQREKMDAIGQLAGGIAHDFNNQLAVITGYGELLLHQTESPVMRKKIGIILAAAQRSIDLTRQLLSYARRAALRQESVDLHALIREVAEMLRRSIDRRIDIVLELEATHRIDGDSSLLQNTLLNLMINARDAMPDGGTLCIATADHRLDPQERQLRGLETPSTDWVVTEIRDTGIGMTPEVKARIFDPFFTTKEPGKGTGLGLATVQGTVHQMGGDITVESRPGLGTTFRILLPAGRLVERIDVSTPPTSSRRLRLLVVDDENDVRGALCEMLTGYGHRVQDAADGPSAVAWFREHAAETDLVLLDLNMPQMNGIDVLKALRSLDAGVHVVIVTGNAETAMSAGVMALGASAIMEKPLSTATLAGLERHARPPGRTVLMIDDEVAYRDIVAWHCAKGGMGLVGTDSLAAALAILAAQPIHVLLIDQHIPGSDGGRILREIRAAGHTMPAIMISGDLHSLDLEALRPLGVIHALEKSGDIKPLMQLIGVLAT